MKRRYKWVIVVVLVTLHCFCLYISDGKEESRKLIADLRKMSEISDFCDEYRETRKYFKPRCMRDIQEAFASKHLNGAARGSVFYGDNLTSSYRMLALDDSRICVVTVSSVGQSRKIPFVVLCRDHVTGDNRFIYSKLFGSFRGDMESEVWLQLMNELGPDPEKRLKSFLCDTSTR